jgi:hypothetical protein
MESSGTPNDHADTEPGADRGPQAGSPPGVVDATGSDAQLEWQDPVATGSDARLEWQDPVATAPGSVP